MNILNKIIKVKLILFLFFGISVFVGQATIIPDLHVSKEAKKIRTFR